MTARAALMVIAGLLAQTALAIYLSIRLTLDA